MSRRDVVFAFYGLSWSASMERGMHFAQDRLAARLIGENRVRRLVIANLPRSAAAWAVRRALGQEREPPYQAHVSLCQPLRLRRRDPHQLGELRRAYARYERCVRRSAARAGLEDPAVITTNPFFAAFGNFSWAGAVTYYATDDWTGHPVYRRWWPALEEAYASIRERECAVCSVSQAILDRIRPMGPARVIPNGIEPSEWPPLPPAPAWLSGLPAPRLIYLGTLDRRLDPAALRALAASHPEGSVVLVGPIMDEDHIRGLLRIPNVQVRPPVSRSEVPGLLRGADVGLVPHARDKLTLAMSPLKAYEYLAAGVPVAGISLPPLEGIDPRVALVDEASQLGGAVNRALSLGRASENVRQQFLDQNAWKRRHEQILELALR